MADWLQYMEAGRRQRQENRAIERQNQLAQLASKAYMAPAEKQQGLIQSAIGVNPEAGFALSTSLQQDRTTREDRSREILGYSARLLTSVPPEARAGVYAKVRPQLESLGMQGLPMTYEENPELIDRTAQGVARSVAGGNAQNLTPSLQSLIWQRDNGILTPEQFNTAVMVQNRLEAGAAAPGYKAEQRWNPQTQQMETVFVQTTGYTPGVGGAMPGVQQSAPAQGGPMSIPVPGGQIDVADPAAAEFLRQNPDVMRGLSSGQPFDVAAAPTQQPPMQSPASGPRVAPGAAFPAGPSYAEEAEQVRREAIAREQGATEGQGPRKPEEDLRKEYMTAVATARDTLAQFKKVEQAAQTPSAAGDLALIFSFMKMLDPGSVVREQEFANAQDAAGVPDQIINLYNRVLSGERLNPNQRQDFLGQARNLAAEAQRSFDENRQFYTDLARQYNLNPGRVVRGAGDISGAQDQGGGQTYQVGQIIEVGGKRYRVTGGDPNDPDVEEVR